MTRRRDRRARRLVINVCALETGSVNLPVNTGTRPVPMDARAIRRHLEALVCARGLSHLVRIREACAGGCTGPGPNISVTMYPAPMPGEPPNEIATAWRTYVYTLPTLPCLAAVIDDNV